MVGLVLVAVIGAAVVAHHAEPAMGNMGHHDMSGMAAMQLCLGAFVLVGAAVVLASRGSWSLGRWKPVLRLAAASPEPPRDVLAAVPRPGGSHLLQLLCISRR